MPIDYEAELKAANERQAEILAEVTELRERLLRQAADFENYRKRAQREREDLRRYATSDVLEQFLPVADNLEFGLASAREHHPEAKAVIDGVAMVQTQLRSVLEANGVEPIEPQGEKFDPNLHESVAHEPHEEIPEGHVSAVHRMGYRLHGRVLRAATVVVSAGPAGQASEAAATPAGEDNQPES